MRQFLLSAILLVALVSRADAAVRRLCAVWYETKDGWSEEHYVEVTFLTEHEFNQNPLSSRSQSWSWEKMALLSLKDSARENLKGEVVVLRLEQWVITAGILTNRDFRYLYLLDHTLNFVEVNSGYPRRWRIRARDFNLFFFFVDPRANQ